MKNTKEGTLDHKIKVVSHKFMSMDLSQVPLGLFSGKMGICIYYYHLARNTEDKIYAQFAEKLLDEIYSQIPKTDLVDVDYGVTGIGWGINYLIKNKFVQGNVNSVLREIDDRLFSVLNLEWEQTISIDSQRFVLLLYYLYERLKAQKKDSSDEYLYQQLIIKIINKLDYNITVDFRQEPSYIDLTYLLPPYLLILSRLFELDFFNYKISKTWDELSPIVLSAFPVLHIHRLWLLIGIQSVLKQTPVQAWQEHATLLEENIDHQKILATELKNKNIHLSNGISGYVLLMNLWDNLNNTERLSLIKPIICDRMNASDCWKKEFSPDPILPVWDIGLWDGFAGVALMYHLFLAS